MPAIMYLIGADGLPETFPESILNLGSSLGRSGMTSGHCALATILGPLKGKERHVSDRRGMALESLSTVWVDAYGQQTITRVNSNGGAGAAAAALYALSNAGIVESWEGARTPGSPSPTAAAYQSIVDRAALLFLCADNTIMSTIVPAPQLGIFLADGETVDITNAAVATFATAAIASPLTNNAGSPVTTLVNGYRLPGSKSPL